MVKAFDSQFFGKDFDIFLDEGPTNNTDYLYVNATKINRYITPVAFLETRLANGTHYKEGVKFDNCK